MHHRLFIVNDIRTGWCRTTPLWGRGLSEKCTGASDRLHDCRARTVIEAIMWHGAAQSDARWSVEKFRTLSKDDRDAVVEFIVSISPFPDMCEAPVPRASAFAVSGRCIHTRTNG